MACRAGGREEAGGEGAPPAAMPPLGRRETMDLLHCYYRIENPTLRRRVFGLLVTTVAVLEAATG